MTAAKLPFIDLGRQYRENRAAIDARMQAVLDHGQYIMGPEVAELESRLGEYVGGRHCIGVADGTTALQIAMMALGIGPGDEVITTSFTFVSTAETITLLGATPVFVDIDPATFNIDPTLIAAAISERTRAILPVSLYGRCADFSAINTIAQEAGVAVIEDAAQSFGATHHGVRSCALSTVATTSFFPSKPLGCYGDGGACFTDSDELARAMRSIRVHGQSERYVHARVGLNGRLDTLQAAVLLAKLDLFDAELERRAALAAQYAALIAERCADRVLALPDLSGPDTLAHAQFTIRVQDRDGVRARLAERGVPTAIHYPVPLHQQPMYAETGSFRVQGSLEHACRAAAEVLSLPFSPWMSPDDCDRVASALADAL